MVSSLSEINFYGGVLSNRIDLLLDIPLMQQKENLVQDIAQISYLNGKVLVDIGWYPADMEISDFSHFKFYVIKNMDWDNPVAIFSCSDIFEFKEHLDKTIQFALNLSQSV